VGHVVLTHTCSQTSGDYNALSPQGFQASRAAVMTHAERRAPALIVLFIVNGYLEDRQLRVSYSELWSDRFACSLSGTVRNYQFAEYECVSYAATRKKRAAVSAPDYKLYCL
jgi:hypothetical protein